MIELLIEEYDKCEEMAKCNLSNRFIRAFSPNAFIRGGFPCRVKYEQELVRYIDSQHAESFERYYNELCKGITRQEAILLMDATEKIHNLTEALYNQHFLVKAPLLAALCCKRIVDILANENKGVHVMEYGAGSGMVGAMLLHSGYRYSCSDVTQAFYLVQNRVLNQFAEINDLCTEAILKDSNYHIPYWKLWEYRNEIKEVDIVTCNHALLEMNSSALKFYLKYSYEVLTNSEYGYFFFQGTGWNLEGNLFSLFRKFSQYGFNLVFYDVNNELAIFSVKGESIDSQVIAALGDDSQYYVHSKSVSAHGIVNNIRTDGAVTFRNSSDGERIYQMYKEMYSAEKLSIEDVEILYSKISEDMNSPDEEFSKYIEDRVRNI